MDEEPAIDEGSLTPETTQEGADRSTSEDGHRPPRWAWFVLEDSRSSSSRSACGRATETPVRGRLRDVGVLARWLEDDSPSGSMGYEGETYHVGVKQPGVLGSVTELPSRQSSIEVGVDASLVSGTGAVSVSCVDTRGTLGRGRDRERAESYDVFVFASEGGVAIVASDRPEEALAVASTGMLHDGMNRVEFGCTGVRERPATLTVTINGTRVLEHEDPVGALVHGRRVERARRRGPAEAAFDNLEVSIR